jgi:apolipoprotein N-acyltransferase
VQWRENRWAFLLCALSGLFGGIIFRQDALGIFAWVALVPYFIALARFRSAKEIVWGTYIFGTIWYYLNLFWLNTLAVFSVLVPIGLPLLAIIQSTYFLAFAFPANYVLRRAPAWLAPWLLAALWPGMEYLRTWTDLAFPWNYLGHTQAPYFLGVIQRTDLFGVYGISALLVLPSGFIATLPLFTESKIPPRPRLERALSIFFIVWVLGYATLLARYSPVHNSSTRVAVIQPGIPQTKKWDAIMGLPTDTDEIAQRRFLDTDREMKDAALALADTAASKQPQLIVFPETTFLSPYFVYQTDLHQELRRRAMQLNADFFFGADNRLPLDTYWSSLRAQSSITTPTLPIMPLRVDDHGVTVPDWAHEPRMANFNSAWLLTPEQGLSAAAYNKMQLVPFGEQVPIIGGYEWFQKLAIAGSFYPGTNAPLFTSHGVRFGSVICFESAFPSLTSALTRKGAQMLVVVTNDAWYDPMYLIDKGGFWGTVFKLPFFRGLAAAGPKQHFAHSVFRAIETRLPLVRAANSGISAVILPSGDITQKLDYSTAGQFVAQVPIADHSPTIYARYGDWFAWLCLVVLVAVLARMVWEKRVGLQKPA